MIKIQEEKVVYMEILEQIYLSPESKIDDIIQETNNEIKGKLNKIDIAEILEKYSNDKELQNVFEKIEDNYNIKVSYLNKRIYEQGFIDGVKLMLEALR